MPKKAPVVPPDRGLTPRAILHEALLGAARTTLELSARASIREKEVLEHLEHLERSAKGKGERLVIKPARCLACGHVFEERRRFSTPSRCPGCQSERISAPSFQIVSAGGGKPARAPARSREREGDDEGEAGFDDAPDPA